jgi:hypothetical protein
VAKTSAVPPETCTSRTLRQVDRAMSNRRNGLVRTSGAAAAGSTAPPVSPVHRAVQDGQEKLLPEVPDDPRKTSGHRETGLLKDSLHILERDGIRHVISEDYSYKTEPYYTILNYELNGINVRPSSSAVLDAYVVPMCLERAKLAGIPVPEWGISQGFVPLPAIIYGLNYFATSADFFVIRDSEKAKRVIAHVTNKGKYPFCFQKIPPDATVHSCVSIFGRTADSCAAIAGLAEKIYQLFSIPLSTMVFVRTGDEYLLSSLSPAKYSRISGNERALLNAYLAHQEFL